MNQILVSEKIYVTPDMKKKKKLFKVEFFLSVFLLCILSSYAIYAEYDRNKSEEVSQEILANMGDIEPETKIVIEDEIVIILNKKQKQATKVEVEKEVKVEKPEVKMSTASDGTKYYTIGKISIPSIDVKYPILSTTTEELLKTAPCKFWGPALNEPGNFCIVGHNYRNSMFFSKVPKLKNGDKIKITDLSGRTITYEVYDKYKVKPSDVDCTSQLTEGRTEITLITCTDNNKQRVVVKARAIQ